MRRFFSRSRIADPRAGESKANTHHASSKVARCLRICRRVAWLTLVLLGGMVLFFWLRPEGTFTSAQSPAPSAPELEVRVLSWNVLESGSRMLGAPWSERKDSFATLLESNRFDVICMQEAMPEQITFFSSILPEYAHYSVGRDDGRNEGQHCPIFFNSAKYALRNSGTFWLSPTPEKPSRGWGENVPRLCSWVELEDRSAAERFRVYNLHLQLSPFAQPKAARVMKSQLQGLEIPAIITGDFNAPHGWPALQVLEGAGFTNAETSGALTYHVRGKGVRCLDHILTDSRWHVAEGGVLKGQSGTVFPSDHFGLWAGLALRR